MGNVNDAIAVKRTPIIDAHHGGAAVPEVGHTHLGAERQGAVGRREGARTKDFAVGSAVSEEAGAVPTGLTLGAVHHTGRWLGGRSDTGWRGLLDLGVTW